MDADVIVIGAGAAGLCAARKLRELGIDAIVVEARTRLGGRIHTISDPRFSLPIELGAEFLHDSDETIDPLLAAAGLIAADMRQEHRMLERRRLTAHRDFESAIERLMKLSKRVRRGPVEEALKHASRERKLTRAVPMLRSYIEGFHAADPRDLSAAEFARGGGPGESLGRVINGYGRLVDWLAAGLGERERLVTGAVVERIEWKRGSVRVHARSTATGGVRRLHARRAIVTLPLGVLAAPRGTPGTPLFEPEPATQLAAARSLGFGSVVRGVLRFADAFWEEGVRHLEKDAAERAEFFHARGVPFPTFWTSLPLRVPELTAWAAGPAAERLRGIDHDALVSLAVKSLARIFGEPVRRIESSLEAWHFCDWHRETYSRGAYSYVRPGAERAIRALARPASGTIFFAGEATEWHGGYSTVSGALKSGLRAAEQIAG